MHILLAILLFTVSLTAAYATNKDAKGSTDYPSIGRLEGSYIKKYNRVDFDEYRIFTAPVTSNKAREKYTTLEGSITRIAYYAPKGVSILEAQLNYENRMKESGFGMVFSCGSKECGGTNLSHSIEQYIGLDAFNMRYAVAKKVTPKFETHVVVATSTDGSKITKTQVIIIESAVMQDKMIDASAMAKAISETGSIAIYGIYFDSGKSVIKAESIPILKEIATLLKNQPSMKLIVVGHTDNQGSYSYNISLSKQRALSVVREMVKKYGIKATRLSDDGVGYLAPVASNRTEEGRAKNRRVQLVEQQ